MGLLLLAAAPSHAEVRTYRAPQHQGYRLSYCLAFGQVCGEQVAMRWCRGQGYEYASDWAIERSIGDRMPTVAIDDDRVCRSNQCDGFETITCGREGRSFRLPNLGAATRATVITPDRRGAAPATVSRGRRGEGRLRGDADFSVNFALPVDLALGETCLQRDRYHYYPTGPQGGLSQIDETAECGQPVEGSIEPHEDDLLRAYDLCEGRSAWGSETDGSIELLVAGLYHLSARTPADGLGTPASTRIVAPYLTIRAPLSINCRD